MSLIFLGKEIISNPFYVLTPEKAKQRGQDIYSGVFNQVQTGSPLGVFWFPIWNFIAAFNTLKRDNPELSEQAAAATAYFSMLAQTPLPTLEGTITVNDWEKEIENWGDNPYLITGYEFQAFDPSHFKKPVGIDLDYQTAYYYQIKKLQHFIAVMGLGEGIQKTLNEQSRKAQAEKAQAQEAQAAAAYAAAMAKKSAENVEISRKEAAEQIAKANAEYTAALEKEAAEQKKLDNISKGLPADYDENAGSNKLISVALIAAAAAGVYLIAKRGK